MKKPALQNKDVGVLGMAFRARKVFGTFEKRAPEVNEFDHRIFGLLKRRERPENWGLKANSNPDLCDAVEVLHH